MPNPYVGYPWEAWASLCEGLATRTSPAVFKPSPVMRQASSSASLRTGARASIGWPLSTACLNAMRSTAKQ
jgi:hypothetical protein